MTRLFGIALLVVLGPSLVGNVTLLNELFRPQPCTCPSPPAPPAPASCAVCPCPQCLCPSCCCGKMPAASDEPLPPVAPGVNPSRSRCPVIVFPERPPNV